MTSKLKTYISEYIDADDADGVTVATIEQFHWIEGQFGEQLDLSVSFGGNKRKTTINKTNARYLCEAFGMDEEKWIGKSFRLRKPATDAEKKLGSKFYVVPILPTVQGSVGSNDGDSRLTAEEIAALRVAGLR